MHQPTFKPACYAHYIVEQSNCFIDNGCSCRAFTDTEQMMNLHPGCVGCARFERLKQLEGIENADQETTVSDRSSEEENVGG